MRVLLPVQEVLLRLDAQRVAVHRRARVRRRPKANDLRAEQRRRGVAVTGLVGQSDANGHGHGLDSRARVLEELLLDGAADVVELSLQARPRIRAAPGP